MNIRIYHLLFVTALLAPASAFAYCVPPFDWSPEAQNAYQACVAQEDAAFQAQINAMDARQAARERNSLLRQRNFMLQQQRFDQQMAPPHEQSRTRPDNAYVAPRAAPAQSYTPHYFALDAGLRGWVPLAPLAALTLAAQGYHVGCINGASVHGGGVILDCELGSRFTVTYGGNSSRMSEGWTEYISLRPTDSGPPFVAFVGPHGQISLCRVQVKTISSGVEFEILGDYTSLISLFRAQHPHTQVTPCSKDHGAVEALAIHKSANSRIPPLSR